MTAPEIAADVVARLNSLGLDHMVVGAFSSNLYGIPQSTRYLDIVVKCGSQTVKELVDILGPHQMPHSSQFSETMPATSHNVVAWSDSEFKVELFQLCKAEFEIERFRRRQRVPFAGLSVFVVSPEDVIITKLHGCARPKRMRDRDDVCDVLAVQGQSLDLAYIYSWRDCHGTRELLDEIRASIPPID